MADNEAIQLSAEFEKLPLDVIVASPLEAAVSAQSRAAAATRDYLKSLLDKDGKPIMVNFEVGIQENAPSSTAGGTPVKQIQITAPLISIVPVPHLRIDSLTTHFKYEISQIVKSTRSFDKSADVGAQTGALLSPWVSATLKGSLSSKSSEESTMNRSGVLEITVHASEAPMPEGLAKILGILANAIQVAPAGTAPGTTTAGTTGD